ncbi:MAG: metal ABC transporter substrate-binding protein [Eubacteriales bacterium]
MRTKKIKLSILLLLAVFVLGGCVYTANGNGTTAVESTEKKGFTIVTSFFPMYVATINITKGIDSVKVINMTKPQTGCLHDYQLTPQDLITLETADAFVVNGAGMETFLSEVIVQQQNLKIVEASKGINILKNPSGEENPHVWVSITNVIKQVRNIADQLALIDSINAVKYESNANAYIIKLETLRTKMHTSLEGLRSRNIITFHEAFPYFAQEFNLKIVAVIEREPGTAPTPKELAGIIDTINHSRVKALFAEPQYSLSAAETIAAETGAKIYTLDPAVTGNSDSSAYDSYMNIMEGNLKSLIEAMG